MEKLYGCDNMIFQTRHAAEEYAKHVHEKVEAFAQIRYINKTEREMTLLEKKKTQNETAFGKNAGRF